MHKPTGGEKRFLLSRSLHHVDRELKTRLEAAYNKSLTVADSVNRSKCFYEIQTFRELGTSPERIGFYVLPDVSKEYQDHITNVVKAICTAAPGLCLYKTEKNQAKIRIGEGEGEGCYTQATYQSAHGSYVHLDTDWPNDWKEQTTVHELLHALGFEHEFKRKDATLYVKIKTDDDQYIDESDHQRIRGLTRFDPFSVMMYPETENMERNENGDKVWRLKSGPLPNKQMSELDKVSLNMVFRPCKGNEYDPQISDVTDMLYCGRRVMAGNQQNTPTDTDGRCGPNNWANCPACRVLTENTKRKCKKMLDEGKLQGWSGLFYCGRKFTDPKTYTFNGVSLEHDGVCGPDNGPPCTVCGRQLYPRYDYDLMVIEDSSCVII